MITKSNSFQSTDNILNSTINEEILIKSLIDEIYKAEEKISQINNSKNISQNGINLNHQKLFELKAHQNNLQQKLILLNEKFQSEISTNKSHILSQTKILNDLDNSIKEMQIKLSGFNTMNFKSPILSKYAIENNINNNILSPEQINEILKSKNNQMKNEDEIKQIMRELEINKASESVIINNKKEINKKNEQINENLKMIKEEKLSIKDELIDILSYKESLECINKNNILNLIRNINSKSNINNLNKIINNNNEDEDEQQLELYLYELSIIDPNIAAMKICDELSDAFRLINSNRKSDLSYIMNDINSASNSKTNTNINFYPRSKNTDQNSVDISHNFNCKNKSLNNSCVNPFKENNLILNKNTLKILIKEDLTNFIKNNNCPNYSILIKNLLNKISITIIKQLKNNDIIIGSSLQNDLIVYLTYFFKILYYDIIIDNKFKFINKEYKTQKKEYKKIKEIINNELLKLENKHDEIKVKKNYNENQLNMLNNPEKNLSQSIEDDLSPTEKSYLQICIKINSILQQKEEVKNTINNYEINMNSKKIKNESEREDINNELEKIKNEISEINSINELNTFQNNENIINYRKIIAEKFNIIKEQLQIYKAKHGSNLSLYNKFISNINNTIQKTYNKSFFDLGSSKNDFFNNNENNGTIINGAETKSNEKYINININNNPNSDNKNKKIYSGERLAVNHSFNKSINNSINNEENDTNKNISRILNKTISNLGQMSDCNISSNELYLGDNRNHNSIYNIKVEKINHSFFQESSLHNKNSKNRKENKSSSQKKSNIYDNFDILNKNIFNLNNFIKNKKNKLEEEEKGKDRDKNKDNKDGNSSKTFSRPFFRKQSKSQGGIPEAEAIKNHIKAKNNILNINLFRHKKNSQNSGAHKGIPTGSKITSDPNSKNDQNIKSSIKNIKAHISRVENHNDTNNYLYKLNPLTKITFCYYREISSDSGNINKYNPLKNISSKELCEYPYNFIKSTISLNKNFSSIKIVPSTQLEPIDFKISMVENTVVSSIVKSIIDIHRNYFKWKENNKGNSIINDFIDEQLKKYNNLNLSDIQKCIVNKNFNFSLIINGQGKEKNNKRIEFIICSYDEFKMWINGMAFIIKNKNNILKIINER